MLRIMRLALVLALAAGCGGSPKAPAPQPSGYRDGLVEFIPLGVTTGITSVIGSHADLPSKNGQVVFVRLAVINHYRTFHDLDVRKQLLVTSDGRQWEIDGQATSIKRQPTRLSLGSGNRVEFDLYYDIPATARPKELLLYGEPVTDLGVALPEDPGVRAPLAVP
ncbi:DUF4352 domain-containing protein [Actinocorallia longicatena]|uniref:DUF4352 domain-containing protein n=1 Tax=Actinocorallia longicatena TaxID=111803 RepID=A0ABP6QC75_9ACTN